MGCFDSQDYLALLMDVVVVNIKQILRTICVNRISWQMVNDIVELSETQVYGWVWVMVAGQGPTAY